MRDGLRFCSVAAVLEGCHDRLNALASAVESQCGHRVDERRNMIYHMLLEKKFEIPHEPPSAHLPEILKRSSSFRRCCRVAVTTRSPLRLPTSTTTSVAPSARWALNYFAAIAHSQRLIQTLSHRNVHFYQLSIHRYLNRTPAGIHYLRLFTAGAAKRAHSSAAEPPFHRHHGLRMFRLIFLVIR